MAEATQSRIELTLPSDLEIRMVRVFDAPRDIVFEAHTSCKHLKHWWGLKTSELVVCDLDFRPGGKYRYVERQKDGSEDGFRGEFREIVRPERIVQTFEYEGMPGHISVDTMTLEEHDGKTTMTSTSLFASKEDRDGMLQSGMEVGANEMWDSLAEYVKARAK
jgi:uncharacterized protein YndB with AHSA1/START domain